MRQLLLLLLLLSNSISANKVLYVCPNKVRQLAIEYQDIQEERRNAELEKDSTLFSLDKMLSELQMASGSEVNFPDYYQIMKQSEETMYKYQLAIDLYKTQNIVFENRFREVCYSLAVTHEAAAVLTTTDFIFVTSLEDVTLDVVKQLNNDYKERKLFENIELEGN